MTIRLVVRKRDAKRLKLGTKDTVIGSAATVVRSSAKSFTVKVAKKWRKKLRTARKLTLLIRATGKAASGRTGTASRTLRVRR